MMFIIYVAFAAQVDKSPSGTIITVRPEAGESACVLDAEDKPLEICSSFSQPYWLVHPDAWRKAVAMAEGTSLTGGLTEELQQILKETREELSIEKQQRSSLRLDLSNLEGVHDEKVKEIKKSRSRFLLGGIATGVLAGSLGTALVLTNL